MEAVDQLAAAEPAIQRLLAGGGDADCAQLKLAAGTQPTRPTRASLQAQGCLRTESVYVRPGVWVEIAQLPQRAVEGFLLWDAGARRLQATAPAYATWLGATYVAYECCIRARGVPPQKPPCS